MATTITFSIFSGRSNPTYELNSLQESELFGRLNELKEFVRLRVTNVTLHSFGIFKIVSKTKERTINILCGGGLIELAFHPFSYVDTANIASYLISCCPDRLLNIELKREISAILQMRPKKFKPISFRTQRLLCPMNGADDAPFYEPNTFQGGWNGNAIYNNHQLCNNCYDYANNKQTDTYSQPGFGSGLIFDESLYACGNERSLLANPLNSLAAASIRDGLVKVKNCNKKLLKGEGWYVALLTGKVGGKKGVEQDFHWVRQDATGCWSHKLGWDSASDTDSLGRKIADPKNAQFRYNVFYGIPNNPELAVYKNFCGYFITNSAVKIKGRGNPNNCADWGA